MARVLEGKLAIVTGASRGKPLTVRLVAALVLSC